MSEQTSPIAQSDVSAVTIEQAIARACDCIAPAWPLDQSVAVNPLWSLRGLSIQQAAARVAARGGALALPERCEFRRYWNAGRIDRADLEAASVEAGLSISTGSLVAHLDQAACSDRVTRVADQLDAARDLAHCTAWTEEIVHQISQLCAAEFDRGQGDWPATHASGLYTAWRYNVCRDRGIAILMGVPGLQRHFESLPAEAEPLIHTALADMALPAEHVEAYLHALLLSVNGWASWCAYRSWQAAFADNTDPSLRELLAVRLAWDWMLYCHVAEPGQAQAWRQAITRSAAIEARHRHDRALDWIWLRALELGYQRPLVDALAGVSAAVRDAAAPTVQAVFCIDVRSEVFRRAFEATGDDVQTLGFAGFFGAPIAYQALGTAGVQPQLPALLSPSLIAHEESCAGVQDTRRQRLRASTRLRAGTIARRFRWGSTSTFSYVESTGLLYAFKLLKDGLLHRSAHRASKDKPPNGCAQRRPVLRADGKPLPIAQRVALAAGALRGMSLTRGFAPLVVLAGHASQTRNNPQQSALDCGACGGHSGEVNARVMAALLNESEVRAGLCAEGIEISQQTRFVAALHNTTTDAVTLFDLDDLTANQAAQVERLRGRLAAARERANVERAPSIEPSQHGGTRLARALETRASDWSQTRPEWGLAANASLIVAPRWRTRGLNLAGRAFLHEYEASRDSENQVLESIMTAPMIVAHWINFQYYASTVDNRFYGSGNKTLHNVAGGHIGLFEGNGGDLRIGLALQSLHDGNRWVHEPLRLAVFIQAPADAIAGVIAAQNTVRELVDNEWLTIHSIGAPGEPVLRYRSGEWITAGETGHARHIA